jgi:RNA polymerase sigma-70 factor (sigma-E family)
VRVIGVQRVAASIDVGLDFDALYAAQWWPMVRLAKGLVDDVGAAEDVVQDAFAALYGRQHHLRDPQAALGYLRRSVVNAARSVLRRRRTARSYLAATQEVDAPAADHASLLSAEQQAVRAALVALPRRQREVLALRYLGELDDRQIAEATGLSAGGVRSAASRGIAALRVSLGGQL